jgi:hypothetical protein
VLLLRDYERAGGVGIGIGITIASGQRTVRTLLRQGGPSDGVSRLVDHELPP